MQTAESVVLDRLKDHLQSAGMTYRDLARHLKLSEIAIKKLFSRGGLSFSRLAQICEILKIDISEVVADDTKKEVSYFMTAEEDEYFFANQKDFGFLMYLISTGSLAQTEKDLELSRPEALSFVSRLEKLGFVELHAGNRIRFVHTTMVETHPNGKMRRLEGKKTLVDYVNGDFVGHPLSSVEMCMGDYSAESMLELKLEIHRLYKRAIGLGHKDKNLPAASKTTLGILGAIRPWSWDYLKRVREEFQAVKKSGKAPVKR